MAGTVSMELDRIGIAMVLNITWTASSTDGTVPSTAIPANMAKTLKGMSITLGTTNPGTTAPTEGYSITLTDLDGIDVFGGMLALRSAATSEQVLPALTGNNGRRVVDGNLTFALTGNAVNSATGVLRVYFLD